MQEKLTNLSPILREINRSWTLKSKPQLNFNQNTKFFIHENASANIVCEMVAILSWWEGEGDLKTMKNDKISAMSDDVITAINVYYVYEIIDMHGRLQEALYATNIYQWYFGCVMH